MECGKKFAQRWTVELVQGIRAHAFLRWFKFIRGWMATCDCPSAGKWPPVNTDPHARGREAPKPVNSSQAIAPKPAGSPHPAPKPFTVGPKPLATKPVGAKPIAPRPGIGASPRNVCPAPPPAEKSPKPAETQKMASPRAVNPGPEVPPPRPSKGGKFTSPTQKKAPYPLPATPNRSVLLSVMDLY